MVKSVHRKSAKKLRRLCLANPGERSDQSGRTMSNSEATVEALLKLVNEVIAARRAKGQSLSYNTVKRHILQQFSYDFFQQHKGKVQERLQLATADAQRATSRNSNKTSAAAPPAKKLAETPENLMKVLNEFIEVKKKNNQNLSYNTIKRHISQHFSMEFFASHKRMVQERLRVALQQGPTNNRDANAEREDLAAQRSRKLESIFANIEVVLADMKMTCRYPVLEK